MNAGKFIKCYPEVLYTELKNFRDKGYMEALSATDEDLRSFLELSSFFATAVIAKPRLLQLTTFMLQRVRDEEGRSLVQRKPVISFA